MPLFFREKKEISLNSDSTAVENKSSPKVAPEEDLQRGAESKPNPDSEQDSTITASFDDSTAPAEVVLSRKKKPINWVLIGATVWLALPVLSLLFLMSTDGFTRDYVLGRIHWLMKDNPSAIVYFSKALQAKQDTRALEARADCYSYIGDLEKERTDLRELVKSIDLNKQHSWQTYRSYPRLASLEAKLGDVDSAIRIYRLYSTFYYDKGKSDTYYQKDAAYKLLLLGDISKSKELLTIIEQSGDKRDPISNVLKGKPDGFPQVLKALIEREEGGKVSALDTARSIGDKYTWEFRDSRWRSGDKNEVVSWTVEALLCLDDRNTDKARSLVTMAESELSGKDKSEPILDVVKAWLLLEEGRLGDCLKLTATTLAYADHEEDESIVRQNLIAAVHLIRKNAFSQQNLRQQASREEELYKQTHASGRIFTPICFRTSP